MAILPLAEQLIIKFGSLVCNYRRHVLPDSESSLIYECVMLYKIAKLNDNKIKQISDRGNEKQQGILAGYCCCHYTPDVNWVRSSFTRIVKERICCKNNHESSFDLTKVICYTIL